VPLTSEEIRSRLSTFAAAWSVYEGSERSEAQTFLNGLFECYGQRRGDVAHFEHHQAGQFLDLIWPRVCIIEMKAPSEAPRLEKHRDQAFDYWRKAADPERGVPAPRFVVICAFRRLEIWEPGAFPTKPRVVLDLVDLPDQYDALLFLTGSEPVFLGGQAALTRDAVVHITDLYDQLKERRAAGADVLRDFVLQCVWCLFAEDLGQIPEHRFTRLIDGLMANQNRSSEDDLLGLFAWLNNPSPERPAHGQYAGVPYANGSLFEQPARVHLTAAELEHVRAAADFNWRLVEPAIFGSLLEGGLGHDKQWALSAHYTHEADIKKVIQPTVVEPWLERIENLSSHEEALAAQRDLNRYVVLDPACGSGNFLYVAYRELRRLERRLSERERNLRRKAGLQEQEALSLHFPLENIRGIEIDGFAVALARVTLWMGHKLAVDELDVSERTLPLVQLTGIQTADALRVPWPRADAIIGNPPFHGASSLRSILGDEYVEWLKAEFDVGVKDLCAYWFRKAHDSLEPGGRAGLVGTNSISQNFGRGASLDYVVAQGGVMTSAVSTQDWPGEAAVDVSIVNWVKNPDVKPTRAILDGREVPGITPSLRSTADADLASARSLQANRGLSFEGVKPGGAGFVLTEDEALMLHSTEGADYASVVRPYLIGDDIAKDPQQRPRRWIIDFRTMTLEEAMEYPAALAIVRDRVKPVRDKNRRAVRRERWWLFSEPVPAMRKALAPLTRFIASNVQGKRILFCLCDPTVCPSNLTKVFALESDYAMGVLSSTVHHEWARHQSSTLEDRIRYTPTSAFETFPWPEGNDAAIDDAARRMLTRRQKICSAQDIGLTVLHNQMEDGAWTDLKALHEELDSEVAKGYGWSPRVGEDTQLRNAALLELNAEIVAGRRPYKPFPRTSD